jgi:hypothetical protein
MILKTIRELKINKFAVGLYKFFSAIFSREYHPLFGNVCHALRKHWMSKLKLCP